MLIAAYKWEPMYEVIFKCADGTRYKTSGDYSNMTLADARWRFNLEREHIKVSKGKSAYTQVELHQMES